MNDEFEELKAKMQEGVSFDEAYEDVFGDDTSSAVEALEMWLDWGGEL